jgi:hypothetical protein
MAKTVDFLRKETHLVARMQTGKLPKTEEWRLVPPRNK